MNQKNNSSTWAGIILVAFGLLILVDNLDLLYYITPDTYYPPIRLFSWHTIMLVVGAIIVANNSRSVFGWILVAVGGLNIASRFFHFSVGHVIGDFWPLILIGIGLLLVLRRRDHHTLHFHREGNGVNPEPGIPGQSSIDTIDEVSIFNSIKKRIVTENFKGGKITSIFGGSDIWLSDSKLAEGDQILDLVCIFGGIDLYVPKDWRVVVKTTAIFGGFDDNRYYDPSSSAQTDRTLVIKGVVIFGGGDIKN